MADNISITQGSGTTLATKDVGSVHYQKIVNVSDLGTPVPVDASFGFQVDVARLADKASNANNNVIGNVSLGNSQGKTNQLKTGTVVTTAVTADQVIVTYTVTSGKTLYLQYISWQVRLTTYATTATNFGDVSLENPSGTKIMTVMNAHAGVISPNIFCFDEPIPIAATSVIRLVVTPAATTSFTWRGNLGGYEK